MLGEAASAAPASRAKQMVDFIVLRAANEKVSDVDTNSI
jgi:hypothetical protein